MTYSPSTKFLRGIQDSLKMLNIPIYFSLPNPDILEPFIVIGENTSDTSKTAQTGVVIEEITVSIDAYIPADSRTQAEEVKSKLIRAIGRNRRVIASIILDDSIGREIYHISLSITETIC